MKLVSRLFAPAGAAILMVSNIAASSFSSGTPCALDQPGVWETTTAGCRQVGANLEWSGSIYDGTSAPTFAQAKAACDNKADGGFDNWRMPTKAELLSAYVAGSATHLDLSPYYPGSGGDNYWWSSTLQGKNASHSVSLLTGNTNITGISGKVGGRTVYSQIPGVCVR